MDTIVTKNSEVKRAAIIFPKDKIILNRMGEQIKLAIKRRGFTQTLISERSGLSRITIRRIIEGNPTVSLGHYFVVLTVLGLEKDFLKIAEDDILGRKLQDIELLKTSNSNKGK